MRTDVWIRQEFYGKIVQAESDVDAMIERLTQIRRQLTGLRPGEHFDFNDLNHVARDIQMLIFTIGVVDTLSKAHQVERGESP